MLLIEKKKSIMEKQILLIEKTKSIIEKQILLIEKTKSIIEKQNLLIEKSNLLIQKSNSVLQKQLLLVEKQIGLGKHTLSKNLKAEQSQLLGYSQQSGGHAGSRHSSLQSRGTIRTCNPSQQWETS